MDPMGRSLNMSANAQHYAQNYRIHYDGMTDAIYTKTASGKREYILEGDPIRAAFGIDRRKKGKPASSQKAPVNTVAAVQSQQTTNTKLIGASKPEVDAVLSGWSAREDRLSRPDVPIWRYTQDVIVIVAFKGGKSIGLAVIDRPGAGVTGIPETRFRELVALIGQKPHRVKRDGSGIREFYAGESDTW
jgi:hypothetical protein